MTVLQENTTGGVSSNRTGKVVTGLALVVVGLAAAFGLSQALDQPETESVSPAAATAGIQRYNENKARIEGLTGAAPTWSPGAEANTVQQRATSDMPAASVSQSATIEVSPSTGFVIPSDVVVNKDLNARIEAGKMLLKQYNEAAVLQTRIEGGEAIGKALAAAAAARQSSGMDAVDELDAIRSNVRTTPATPAHQPSGPR